MGDGEDRRIRMRIEYRIWDIGYGRKGVRLRLS